MAMLMASSTEDASSAQSRWRDTSLRSALGLPLASVSSMRASSPCPDGWITARTRSSA
jgi:hypothetical protein